jgi:DNA-binding MarR family transcriptional regulator
VVVKPERTSRALTPSRLAGELLREVACLYTRAQRTAADCCRTGATRCPLRVEPGRSGPVPLTAPGARLSLEKSRLSRAVDGLVGQGWATRQPHPLDARSWLATLTTDGRVRMLELDATIDKHAARLLRQLRARDRAAVRKPSRLLLRSVREEVDIASCCLAPRPCALAKDRTSCC